MTCRASSADAPPAGMVLAVNACEATLQVAAGRMGHGGPEVLWERHAPSVGQAMGRLGPALAEALAELGVSPAGLSGLACVHGPGSFTGLRVALSTALGFSLGSGVPLAGLDYLPLLAAGAAPLLPADATALAVLTHARRGLVYYQGFAVRHGSAPTPLGDLRVLPLAAAAAAARSLPGPAACLGSGLHRAAEFFRAELPQAHMLPECCNDPAPAALLAAALSATYGPHMPHPVYIRPSDAEENLADIARGRGQDPGLAVQRLELLLSQEPDGASAD